MPSDNSLSLQDLGACYYCTYLLQVGKEASYCLNKKSLEYSPKDNPPRLDSTELTIEQILMGCEKIEPWGKKIPIETFRNTPDDSCLRTLPLNEIISNYSGENNLKSGITAKEMAAKLLKD